LSVREEEEPPRFVDRRTSQRPEAEAGDGESQNSKPAQPEAEQSVEALRQELAQQRERAETNLANWQRSAADFQNYKRRVEQEREEIGRLSNAALIINLLPLMDDLERALDSVDTRLAGMTWLDGVRLIERKFQALMEMNGVTEIEADGQDFDPNVHEAVTFGQGEENKVISVVQKGYRLGGRVLRPSLVVVGKQE